ncbi:MAG: hypothetical protein WD066_12500 [Planctomycetaceae bacterium]
MIARRYSTINLPRARELWEEYQRAHDLSRDRGRTAGIDPESGRVWLGESIPDVIRQRDADGIDAPLHFERVGSPAYARKGRAT